MPVWKEAVTSVEHAVSPQPIATTEIHVLSTDVTRKTDVPINRTYAMTEIRARKTHATRSQGTVSISTTELAAKTISTVTMAISVPQTAVWRAPV